MSSAAALGQDWSFSQDTDVVSISITDLEQHFKPRNICSSISWDTGLTGLQVIVFNKHLLLLYIRFLWQIDAFMQAYLDRTKDQRNIVSRLFIFSYRASATATPGLSIKQIVPMS